jgi:glycosyltransferase involved in cell wall biosynthesis
MGIKETASLSDQETDQETDQEIDVECLLSVVMPALNEEENIDSAISEVLSALDSFQVAGELIVVDDGSTDSTREIASRRAKEERRISLIVHESNKGIGKAFWTGVDHASGQAITMLPGDNENDPAETIRYLDLLQHVDIVIPFVFNKEVRSLFRNALSYIYRFVINTTFLVHFNYTNGTVLYRKSVLKGMIAKNDGFFFQTDILIRAVKSGVLFAEVPYKLSVRRSGVAKAVSFPSFFQVIRGYIRLIRDLYSARRVYQSTDLPSDSLTALRK